MVKLAVLSNEMEKRMNSKLKDGHSVSLGLPRFPLITLYSDRSNPQSYTVKTAEAKHLYSDFHPRTRGRVRLPFNPFIQHYLAISIHALV